MRTEGSFKAVLLDGMGTLVRLTPPAPALAAALGVPLDVAERAFRAEVAYYVVHHLEGCHPSDLGDLRRRCGDVLAAAAGVDPVRAREALMASLEFEAFEDAAPALRALRECGLRTVVVSNWDCSLPDVLDGVGLAPLVDEVIASAVVGVAKPHPGIFEAGVAAAACAPSEVLHVGDSPALDVRGAEAAGIRAVLLDRSGTQPGSISSLAEIPALLS